MYPQLHFESEDKDSNLATKHQNKDDCILKSLFTTLNRVLLGIN